MTNTKNEQENNLRKFAFTGNLAGIQAILKSPVPGFDINSSDQAGCSALFLALSQGFAARDRSMIDILLANGAVIANGVTIVPSKTPKLLTRHANAMNLARIFQTPAFKLCPMGLILEIGSGEGYLKYLMSLHGDPAFKNIINHIVETEISADVVAKNLINGKHVINTGIADLAAMFGRGCFTCVISMNVLDTFTPEELLENLRMISEVLVPGGIVIHIMSSAIHENLFAELENSFPDRMLLPYYREGHIGLRLIPVDHPWIKKNQIPRFPAGYWSGLFAENPGKFVELADFISANRAELGFFENSFILFKDHTVEKIKTALAASGYELLGQEEVASEVMVVKDEYHGRIPEANCFNNILGTLITDYYPPDRIKPGEVMEKSTFLWVMGRWNGKRNTYLGRSNSRPGQKI